MTHVRTLFNPVPNTRRIAVANALHIACFIFIACATLDKMIDDKRFRFNIGFAGYISLLVLQAVLEAFHWKFQKSIALYSMQSLQTELQKSQTAVAKLRNKHDREYYQESLSEVQFDAENPFRVHLPKLRVRPDQTLSVTFEVGHGVILKQLSLLKEIADEIRKKHHIDYFSERPRHLSFIAKTLPLDNLFCMPTKRRIFSLTGITSILFSLAAVRFSDVSYFMTFYLASYPLLLAATCYDIYFTNNAKSHYKHEGFIRLQPGNNDIPLLLPVSCIPRQINQQLIFYPRNRTLTKSANYILNCMQGLEHIEHMGFQLTPTLREKIAKAKRNVSVTSDQPNHTSLTFSPNV